jgi:hypothetical protein
MQNEHALDRPALLRARNAGHRQPTHAELIHAAHLAAQRLYAATAAWQSFHPQASSIGDVQNTVVGLQNLLRQLRTMEVQP